VRKYAAVLLILICLAVPFAEAAVPADTQQAGPVITGHDFNVTSAGIANHSIPYGHGIQPAIIHVELTVSETILPAMKGEMAAGPRTIGFSVDPLMLAVLIVAIIAGAAGVLYAMRRRPEEEDGREDEGSGE
jgi:hypothetical protein